MPVIEAGHKNIRGMEMPKICFHCGKKIEPTLIYSGFNCDGEIADIAFHPICQAEFAKILIDSLIIKIKQLGKQIIITDPSPIVNLQLKKLF
jgi:hypothetical protein